jgi:hypothetical protein
MEEDNWHMVRNTKASTAMCNFARMSSCGCESCASSTLRGLKARTLCV